MWAAGIKIKNILFILNIFNWINVLLKSKLLIDKIFNKITNKKEKKEEEKYRKLKTG